MNTRIVLGSLRILVSISVLAAVITQFTHGLDTNPHFNTVNFFSFFTIQSNILAALVMLVAGFFLIANKWSMQLDSLRGATTLYMAITGITYFLLLRGIEDQLQTPIPWVNIVLHYAFPIAILLDWFVSPLTRRIKLEDAVAWLIFPVVYLTYTLVRGSFVLWYPYPFLNPMSGGYLNVALMCCVIAVIAILGALILIRNKTVLSVHQPSFLS